MQPAPYRDASAISLLTIHATTCCTLRLGLCPRRREVRYPTCCNISPSSVSSVISPLCDELPPSSLEAVLHEIPFEPLTSFSQHVPPHQRTIDSLQAPYRSDMSQRDESDAHEQPRQPQERDQEETWLDFLWSAGGTVASGRFSSRQQPSNEPQRPPTRRTDSQDRKRPLTAAPEPERRGHFPSHRSYTGRVMLPGQNFGASGNENGAGQTGDGTTVETTIDLATSPIASRIEGPMRRVADESRRDSEGSRRGSDQLPRWQPDEEVAKCPVCGNAFNFWTRRHHCR